MFQRFKVTQFCDEYHSRIDILMNIQEAKNLAQDKEAASDGQALVQNGS